MTYQCSYCGRSFDREKHGQRVHRFCSRKCAAQTAKAHHPNAHKTRCRNGHVFTPENTGRRAGGGRWCRTCHNDIIKAANDLSRDHASNHGKQWTGPQLEIASRSDLTNADVSKITGRTIGAVEIIRRRLKDDPRLSQMARP